MYLWYKKKKKKELRNINQHRALRILKFNFLIVMLIKKWTEEVNVYNLKVAQFSKL